MDPNLQETLRLRDLRLIDAVAREGTLVGASRRLKQSQPATTKALQALEAVVGVKLFERTSKGVEGTSSGRLIAVSAARVLDEIRGLDMALADLKRGERQTLTVGAEIGTADAVLMAALAETKKSQPHLDIRVIEGGCERLIDDLSGRRVDLVVGRLVDCASVDHLRSQPLYDEPIALMARANHPLFNYDSVDPQMIDRFHALVAERTGQVAVEVDAFMTGCLVASPRSVKCGSVDLVKEMVHITDCVIAGPATFFAGDIRRGDVKIVPLPQRSAPRAAGYIQRKVAPELASAAGFLEALSVSAARVQRLMSW